MSVRHLVSPEDLEDLRLAVVMNGGVSLAVWIGGVTQEINRLANAHPVGADPADVYAGLLDIVKTTARVDVIAGTSAGGLNGGFLALARCYRADLSPLRNLWATKGSLGALFRNPFEKDPPSLLRGDEYFLPELRSAFATIFPTAADESYLSPDEAPIDLTMTTSVMTGIPRLFRDDYGTAIQEVDHKGRFHFRRGPRTAPEDDPFARPAIIPRLALASRSTASFPFAFEPSYVPVGKDGPDSDHPDMAGYSNFANSRFVLDGGVLLNKPVQPALEAIFRLPAERQVRRVLAYVNPDPGAMESLRRDDDLANPPTLPTVMMDSLSSLPRAQSISAELDEIRDHNRRVRERRRSRVDFIEMLGPRLVELAEGLFAAYRRVRVSVTMDDVAERVAEAASPLLEDRVSGAPPQWTHDELAAAVARQELPFVPASADALTQRADQWEWGLAPIDRLASAGLDLFKRAMWVAPIDESDLRERLRSHRMTFHEHLVALRPLLDENAEFWKAAASSLPAPPAQSEDRPEVLGQWAETHVKRWPATSSGPGEIPAAEYRRSLGFLATSITSALVDARDDLYRAVDEGRRSQASSARDEAERLHILLDVLFPPSAGTDDPVLGTLARLLRVEVAFVALGGQPTGVEQEVGLIQLSGNTPNSFGGPAEATKKLAGIQVAHFGAFYKQSWRANDWTWGRIDGATRLCQIVLSASRLKQLQVTTDEALGLVRSVAVEQAAPGDVDALARMFPEKACRDELTFLDDDTRPMPPSLPTCSMSIARRTHLAILREELPNIATGVEVDLAAKASPEAAGIAFLRDFRRAQEENPRGLPVDVTFSLFANSGIGSEKIADEVGTDLFASTVSTAAAVSVSVVDSPRTKLGPLRLLTRSLRGVMTILYALVRGAVSSGRFANAAVAFVLAFGGALVAVSIVGEDPAPFVAGLGASIAIAGVMLAALRSKMKRFALVMLGLIAVIATGLVILALRDRLPTLENVVTAGIVFAVVLFFFLLGFVREKPPQ
jgi:patatin-related protein